MGCYDDSESKLCDYGNYLNISRKIVVICEGIGGVLSIFLLERIVFLLLKKPYGHTYFIYTFAIMITGLKLVGFLSYISLVSADFTDTCDPSMQICNEDGPKYLLASLVFCVFGSFLVILVFYFRSQELNKSLNLDGLEKIKTWLNSKVLISLIIGVLFIGISLAWDWVYFYEDEKLSGALFYLVDYKNYENIDFSCIAGPICNLDSTDPYEKRYCDGMKSLSSAAEAYK